MKLSTIAFGSSELGPEEEDRVVKSTLIILGTLLTLANAVGLYAAIRKSIWSTKTSLVVWIVQMGWVALFIILSAIVYLSMSEEDRKQLPRPSAASYAKLGFDAGLTAFHGWALVVYLRDLKFRPRNVWGLLVKEAGVWEYEPVGNAHTAGPVHL